MRSRFSVGTRSSRVSALTVLLVASVSGLHAQATDARWKPWLGCWASNDSLTVSLNGPTSSNLVCVVPSTVGAGVAIASVANGKIIAQDFLNPTGQRASLTRDGCPGWESATWSADGNRILLRSEFTCAGGVTRKGSGVFGMSPEGEWIQVQGVFVRGNAGIRAMRFHAANVRITFDSSNTASTTQSTLGFSTETARFIAAAPMRNSDILDLSKNVDTPVAEAWLTELGQRFFLNAKALVALADGGLPSRTLDLVVALSYPETFALDKATPRLQNAGMVNADAYGSRRGYGTSPWGLSSSFDMRCDAAFDRMFAYGYYSSNINSLYCAGNRYGYTQSYGYGNGYYWGQTPVIIVTRGPDGSGTVTPQGRAVKGQGYTRDRSAPTGVSAERRSSGSSAGYSSGGSGGGSSSSSGSSSSGSSGGAAAPAERTARPRPPGE